LGLGYRHSALKNLVDLVGPAMAKDLFFTARRIDAKEARDIGLITRVTEPGDLVTLQAEYKNALADNAPITVCAGKAIIAEILKASPEIDYEKCRQLIRDCFESEDYSEGRRAFMEKRKPVFRGK
jgi:enoyl-CoA hydratase/carnithine racemase